MLDLAPIDRTLPFAILFLPFAGFIVLALLGDRIKRDGEAAGAGYLACATVLTSFGLAAWATVRLYGYVGGAEGLRFTQATLGWPPFAPLEQREPLSWIEVAGFRVPFSLLVDPLSCVMMLVVTGIGSLIHVYSLGYMAHDDDRPRFFSYLNLFTFFMLLLVLGGSLPLLFVGWEGVGLCSYLLIGFWYKRDSAAAAGLKAFVVNRIGDVGLILGMVFIFHAFGSVDLVDIADNAGAAGAHDGRGLLADLFREMWALGNPIIARVRGYALAGGFGLALACDVVIAADDAQFGTPEVNVGLWPYMITVPMLRSMPPKTVLELQMTGRRVGAEEAARIGFVNRVVPVADLDTAVDEFTSALATKSPLVLRWGRDAFYRVLEMDADAALDYLQGMLTVHTQSEDAAEGVAAFAEKRTPEWKGR